jgi:hypothetical protein
MGHSISWLAIITTTGKVLPGDRKSLVICGISDYLRKAGWGGIDWIHLAQDREQRRALANTVINLRAT